MNTTTAPLSQLQVFLTVARLSSFSAAARELRVSTSAVSQSVRQLEEHLRVTLLVRTTRSVSLTDEGRRLVENAGPALGQAIDALTQISARPGELVGRLRLSVPRTAVPFVITPMLRDGRLQRVLDAYAQTVPGFFLHYPRRAQRYRIGAHAVPFSAIGRERKMDSKRSGSQASAKGPAEYFTGRARIDPRQLG